MGCTPWGFRPRHYNYFIVEPKISKISVIIVNYNAGQWLERSVRSLLVQTEADFECFIIDNGSKDNSLATLPKLDDRFTVIERGYNSGFASANNFAANLATSPWIALLNPDAFARENWLEELLKAKDLAPNISMVGSTQFLALEDTPTLDGVGDCFHASGIAYRAGYKKQMPVPDTGFVFGPCGAGAMYNRDDYLTLGGFDESFFCYHEDVDLAFRMQLMGKDCVQSATAIIDHVSSAVSNTIPNFAIYHGTRNRIWTFFKNMPLPLLILLTPAHIFANIAYLAWSIVRRRFKTTWRGTWDGIKGLPRIFAARKSVNAHRKLSSFRLLRRLTWSPLKVLRRGVHIRKLP